MSILAQKFNTSKPENTPERLERLKAVLKETPTGRQSLAFLEQEKLKLSFERMQDCFGYFEPRTHRLALNPVCSDADLTLTLVHEIRHAWQDKQIETLSPSLTPAAFLTQGFAIEADACVAEIAFAFENKEKHPELLEAHQSTSYAPMSTAFEETLNTTGHLEKAKESAFIQWYGLSSLKESYAETYIKRLSSIAKNALNQKAVDETVLVEKASTQKLVQSLLKDYEGKPYLKNPEQIESKKCLCVTEFQARKLCSSLLSLAQKNKKTPQDFELEKLSVRQISGKEKPFLSVYDEMKKEREKRQPPNLQALLASRKGGR